MKEVYKEDSAVSEIIGAILLFAIASVLLTSFILWYVPSTGTNNDITYQSGTQQSFASLDSKLLSPSLTTGSAISQSFPLGISGTPPFTPSQSTNLYYSHNFNGSLTYDFTVNYNNIVTKKTLNVAACANASSSSVLNNIEVNNQFTYSINFIESGLSSGYFWTVVISGESYSSSGTLISASFPDGTYGYKISTDSTQQISTTEGSVVVNGSNVNIPVSFYSSSLNGILAENNGTAGAITPINSENQIPDSTSSSNNFGAGTLSNWLTNITNTSLPGDPNYLGAQQFDIYSSSVTATYYTFYILPSDDYMVDCIQGGYTIYSYISKQPFGANLTVVNVTSGSNLQQSFVPIKLPKPLTLHEGSYYLNFLETVNNPEHKYKYNGYEPIGATNGTTGNLLTSQNAQWEYGPTEFIGTMSNPEYSLGVGNAISYSAKYWEQTGSLSSLPFEQSHGYYYEADNFSITSTNEVIGSSNPYDFTIGYNLTSNPTTYNVIFVPEGLNSSSQWNVTINGQKINSSKDGSNITFKLPIGVYQYSVNSSSLMLGDPSIGTVNVTSSGAVEVPIKFSRPRNSDPLYYGISNDQSGGVTQDFYIPPGGSRINFLCLYLFNFTAPPAHYKSGYINDTIQIEIESTSGHQVYNISPLNEKIYNSGWNRFYLKRNGYYNFAQGEYELKVSDDNGSNNIIGWGFATTGGYDNYLQKDAPNSLTGIKNTPRNSNITGFNNGIVTPVSNQTVSKQFTKTTFKFEGAILSNGETQFTITETMALEDGVVITAGKGVTFVTVNPLPIRIVNTTKGVSLSSIAYNMQMSNDTSTSVSGTGSTIVSMEMSKLSLLNYTVGNSYVFTNKLGSVISIQLHSFNYSINSTLANYWADTLLVDLSSGTHYQNFNVSGFNFKLVGDSEYVTMQPTEMNLYSISLKDVNFIVNTI